MKIAVGSDHGGFALKESVKKHLEAKGIEVEDFGCYSTDSVDYAVYAAKVAHCVADGKADYGVLVCSTGIGISMAANKVNGHPRGTVQRYPRSGNDPPPQQCKHSVSRRPCHRGEDRAGDRGHVPQV